MFDTNGWNDELEEKHWGDECAEKHNSVSHLSGVL